MASGDIHSSVSLGIALGAVTGFLAKVIPVSYLTLCAIPLGSIIQIIMSPDMDVDDGYIGDFYIRSIFGNFVHGIYDVWKYPYSIAVKHRSIWSHGLVIGSFIRIIYIFLPITALIYAEKRMSILSVFSAQLVSLIPCLILYCMYSYNSVSTIEFVFGIMIGILLSDIGHIFFDLKFK